MSILWSPTGPQLKPLRGLFWRAVSWSRIAASAHQVSTHLNMFYAQLVAISDVNQKVTVSMPAGQIQTGTIASLLKQAVVSMVVTQIQQGTISVTEGKIVTALVMSQTQQGAIASTLSKTLTAINGVMLPSGTIADQLIVPSTSLAGAQIQSGTITDVLPLAATSLSLAQTQQGTIATSLYQVLTALVGTSINQVVMASTLPKAITALAGIQTQSGTIADVLPQIVAAMNVAQTQQGTIATVLYQVATAALGAQGLGVAIADALPSPMSSSINGYEVPGGPIADVLPPVSTALAGAQAQSGAIIDIIPQTTTAVQGAQTDAGTISSTLGLPSSAVVANQTQGGTVADRLLQISAALNAIEQPKLAVAVALQLASTAITAGQAQSGVVADVLLKAVTSLQSLQTQSGTIASSVIQALTAIAMNVVTAASATYISSATAEATTLTMPAHQAGDLLLMFSYRDGNQNPNTVPAGWTSYTTGIFQTTVFGRLAYKIAASSSETSGTWTNSNGLICMVYRGVLASMPLGAVAFSAASSATVNYPALSLFGTDGTSVVAAFGMHRSINGTMGNAPTGMTQRANREGATADAAGFDTNGGVASWATANVASGETASGYITFAVEILPSGYSGVYLNSTTLAPTASAYAGSASGTHITWNVDTVTGQYAIIEVVGYGGAFGGGGMDLSATAVVKIGTLTLTELGNRYMNNTSGQSWIRVFGAFITSGGTGQTADVLLTQTGGAIYTWCSSYTYNNVGSVGTLQTASGTGTSATVSIGSGAGRIVWGSIGNDTGGTATPFTGFSLTQHQIGNVAADNPYFIAGDGPGATTVTISATIPSSVWAAIGLELRPVGFVPTVLVKGANVAQASSVAIPTHAVGDIIVIYAFRTGSTTVPSKPGASGTVPAYVDIDATTGANTVASRTAYFVATATNHTSGTWTGANDVIAVVLSGQGATPIGGHAESGGTNPAGVVTAPAITLTNTDGSSAILCFYGSDLCSSWNAAPAGYTQRAISGISSDGVCCNTKNDTTSDGSSTESNNWDAINYRGATVEIRAY